MTETAQDIADRFTKALSAGTNGKNEWTDLMEDLYGDKLTVQMMIVDDIDAPYDPDAPKVDAFPEPIDTSQIMAWSRSEGEKMYACYPDYKFWDPDVTVVGDHVVAKYKHGGTARNGYSFVEQQCFVYVTENGKVPRVIRRTTEQLNAEHVDHIQQAGFMSEEDLALIPEWNPEIVPKR